MHLLTIVCFKEYKFRAIFDEILFVWQYHSYTVKVTELLCKMTKCSQLGGPHAIGNGAERKIVEISKIDISL